MHSGVDGPLQEGIGKLGIGCRIEKVHLVLLLEGLLEDILQAGPIDVESPIEEVVALFVHLFYHQVALHPFGNILQEKSHGITVGLAHEQIQFRREERGTEILHIGAYHAVEADFPVPAHLLAPGAGGLVHHRPDAAVHALDHHRFGLSSFVADGTIVVHEFVDEGFAKFHQVQLFV